MTCLDCCDWLWLILPCFLLSYIRIHKVYERIVYMSESSIKVPSPSPRKCLISDDSLDFMISLLPSVVETCHRWFASFVFFPTTMPAAIIKLPLSKATKPCHHFTGANLSWAAVMDVCNCVKTKQTGEREHTCWVDYWLNESRTKQTDLICS